MPISTLVTLLLGELADRVRELGGRERDAAHAVVADGVDEVAGAQQQRQLAEVHLGDEHLAVAAQDLAGVRRERVEAAQVRGRDREPALAHDARGRRDGP